MSQPASSLSFQSLFNAALQDYADQTGTKLYDHSLTSQLEICDSVDSISAVLQEHARRFHEFRGEDGKIMKSLKCIVHVLYTLSTSTILGEGIGIVSLKSLIADFVS
jgi:fungal STAND N-terminal Goodbye domain